jgi:fructan beta-fructosidase
MNKMNQIFQELFRPQVHFTPHQNFMNDPIGLIFYQGKYHLFYQYNPYGKEWGHMSWGHAVSPDLIYWQHLPIALWEEDEIMIFSGSAVHDKKNKSGIAKNKSGSIIAIYTGNELKRKCQTQNLAFSNDGGMTWKKYKGNPVLDIGEKHFRDPKVFWYEKEKKWIMVVTLAGKKIIRFFSSNDLKRWEYLSDFGPAGMKETPYWECPDLFELPIDNDKLNTRWILKVDVSDNAVSGGSGSQYFVGHFDGREFFNDYSPDKILWVDYGQDFYAAQTFSNLPKNQNRLVWMGWMNNWQYANNLPTSPWRGQMTIPRKLSLANTENGICLLQQPVNEAKKLRQDELIYKDLLITPEPQTIDKHALNLLSFELLMEFKIISADFFGIRFIWGEHSLVDLGIDIQLKRIFLDRRNSGVIDFNENFAAVHYAPLIIPNSKKINLRVIVDSCSIEIFANNGEAVITDLIFPEEQGIKTSLFSVGGKVLVKLLQIFTLKNIWSNLC